MLAYSIGGLGMQPFDAIGSVINAVGGAVKSAASAACGVVQNPTVQQGTGFAAMIAGGKGGTQITTAQSYASGVCSVVKPAPASAAAAAQQQYTSAIQTAASAPASARSKYKAGSMTRYNKSRGVWSVYSPLAGAGLFGVISDGRCMGGVCLGEGEVDPPVPPGFVKAGEEISPPPDVAQAGQESDKKPFYLNPIVWAATAGAVALGTGGYFLLRKKPGGLNGAGRRRRRR